MSLIPDSTLVTLDVVSAGEPAGFIITAKTAAAILGLDNTFRGEPVGANGTGGGGTGGGGGGATRSSDFFSIFT